jgi:hypothetical protein
VIVKFNKTAFLVFFIVSLSEFYGQADNQVPKIITDGISIQKPGLFLDGCFYGKNESMSDHAPVLYGDFATWNIAAPVNNFAIRPDPLNPVFFFNHKFHTDEEGNLIGRDKKLITARGVAEVVTLKKAYDAERIKNIINKNNRRDTYEIKKLLSRAYQALLLLIINKNIDKKQKLVEKEEAHNLRLKAEQEINNSSEENYKNTIRLLDALQEGYSAITDLYIARMEHIAKKIKEIFAQNKDLNYMALQELPNFDDKTTSGENIQNILRSIFESQDAINALIAQGVIVKNKHFIISLEKLKEYFNKVISNKKDQPRISLNNELRISFYEPSSFDYRKVETLVAKTNYKKDIIPDVALISRASAPLLEQEDADHDNRLVPWCSLKTKTCFVSAHLPHAQDNDELVVRCNDIKNMALHLKEKGYNIINIAGDFNVSASKMAVVCNEDLVPPTGTVVLHTSPNEKGNSCGSNQGLVAHFNIDILIRYNFTQAKSLPERKYRPQQRHRKLKNEKNRK